MHLLSVIIPTRDRPDLLHDCLASIQAQRVAPEAINVVVVDDGSEGELASVISATPGPIRVDLVGQAPAGLNAARNRGAGETSGELIAFLDDDTLLAPDWATAVIGAFQSSSCSGLAGRIQLHFDGAPPRWLSGPQRAYLAEFDLGPEPCWLDHGPVPVGANCAVRRSAFERLGGFRSGLDRFGASLISNGDTEFFRRIRLAGERLRYEPEAHVLHRVPAERLTRAFIRRRAYAQGISDVLLAGSAPDPSHSGSVARELWRWGRTGPILARGLLSGRGTMNAVQWHSYCHGRLDATIEDSGR